MALKTTYSTKSVYYFDNFAVFTDCRNHMNVLTVRDAIHLTAIQHKQLVVQITQLEA